MKVLTSFALLPLLLSAGASAYPSYGHGYGNGHGQGYAAHRSILYFAPDSDNQVRQFLRQSLQNHCQLQERDVVILVVTPQGFEQTEYQLSGDYARELRKRYAIKPGDHAGVLIGKDGTEKHRWDSDTNWQEIMQIIDAMPMRQREMSQQISPCAA